MTLNTVVTLKIWHGGTFKKNARGELDYAGGQFRCFDIDADELCWFWLEDLAGKCGKYSSIDEIYYLIPGKSLETGLRSVKFDAEVREMYKVVIQYSTIDLYIRHGLSCPELVLLLEGTGENIGGSGGSEPHTTAGTGGSTTQPTQGGGWEETKTPDANESDPSDEELNDESENKEQNEDVEIEGEGVEELEVPLFGSDNDTSDEEFLESRKRVTGWNSNIIDIAKQLQKDALEGAVGGKMESNTSVNDQGDSHDNDFVSEYEDSDEDIHTPPSSDNEDSLPTKKRGKVTVVDAHTDFSKLKWQVGMRFENREKFKDAITRFAISQGRNLKIHVSSKSRQQRVGAKCVDGCPFRLYASWHSRKGSLVVKSVQGDHTCNRNMKKNRQLKASWVAEQFLEVFKSRPHWPAKEIIETIRRGYKVLVHRDYAYKVKYHAHKKLHGSMKDHYNKLGRYLEALTQANPLSHFKLLTDPKSKTFPPTFQRFFVCFNGLLDGWLNAGRRVLCVDGCFIKTFLGGMLLSVVGRDSNDQMFPLAWAVVEGENNSSWEWFLLELKKNLGHSDGADLTFISDEHQSILRGVSIVFPMAEHRHCARHVFANWHKTHKGDELKMLFWKAVKAYNEADMQDALDEMEKVSPSAVIAFKACNPHVFCRAYVRATSKCDVIVSNMAETFNGYIINARAKHIIFMLEDIRGALMQRMVVKREAMEKSLSMICPRIQSRLEKAKHDAAQCTPLPSSQVSFQVSHYLDTLTVNLESKSCTCRRWDLSGIPCCHAVACMFFLNATPEDYVHNCYTREAYMKMYSGCIAPLTGERHWPKVELPLDPPPIKIGPGRPRKNRIKPPYENPKKPGKLTRHGVEMSCSICKSKAHNKRKCPDKNKPVEPQPKRSRGRPRKHIQAEANSTNNHEITAHPSRLGRGGRVIPGRGESRGGSKLVRGGSGRSSQRRGRGHIPVGYGVIIDDQGHTWTNSPGQHGGLRNLSDT